MYSLFISPQKLFFPENILYKSKFKALPYNKINVTKKKKKLKFLLGTVENILRKGENAGYQHFLLFSKCFQKPPFSGLLKVGTVWLRDNNAILYL